MPIVVAAILLQVACAVHCVRHRGNNLWLMMIIFMPVAGSLAYIVFEILPVYSGPRQVRRVKATGSPSPP